ncbi:site-specific DNA-methyltransferase [Brevibacterium ammoniilyticum]|uniref:Site-specific DNA-methyltransferase n=1 Tax=Brevibacterium ammoniilyticum TaxID=1046555 RepID=A0ABP9U7Z6_9MICO
MTSPDFTVRNIERLADLFPQVITESKNAEGEVTLAVDFDLLRQELSDHVVEGPQERYRLDWPGKRAAAFAANAPIAKTLRPVHEESVNFDTTKNLFIEGDNLNALKLLQESYLGKVKLIYIDPPYNTGNDFVYNDNFAETSSEYLARSSQVTPSGERLTANTESNGRFHSNWLSMMYSRLKLARTLLSDDGVIAISIDDKEAARLGQMLDELFGNDGRVAQVVVQANKGGRDYLPLAQTHEYLVIYGRTDGAGIYDLPRDTSALPLVDETGPYEARELRNRNPKFHRGNRPNLFYSFYINPDLTDEHGYSAVSLEPRSGYGIETVPRNSQGEESCWRWGRDRASDAIQVGDPRKSQLVARQVRTGSWNVYEKHRPTTQKAKTIWDETEVRTEAGTREVRAMFGAPVFDHPKPLDLLKKLISISTVPESIVMDFFAGSGSTAHAVMELNHLDGGRRQFISVQLDEACETGSVAAQHGFRTIADIGRERLRKAGDALGVLREGEDVGFRSLRVDNSNKSDVLRAADDIEQRELSSLEPSILAGRSGDDLLFQVLLDWGLELTLAIVREDVDGHEVFSVEDDALIACFAESVTPAVVRQIAERGPLRTVFRDDAFESDAARINAEQVFREISPATEVRTI